MEFIIIIVMSIISLLVLLYFYHINWKIIKEIKNNDELNRIVLKLPSNIKVCKKILSMLGNESVKVEENLGASSSLYIALTDKISIANTKDSYTRIQTVAHECIHSIQDRRLLLFNFFFTNIYLLYFVAIIVLTILRILPFPMLFLAILLVLGLIHYTVRSYLENDAMIKAEYLAKEYMQKDGTLSKTEIDKIVSNYNKINPTGIKMTNFNLVFNIIIKVILFALLTLILNF